MHSSKPKIEVLPGFDVDSGNNWIYPTNYPLRDYQYNITQKALFKNTLVTLPTGLGKTFIAAVVMYNFFRWYPNGKVVFMAPTKPLVAQQEEACYNVTGIPRDTTIRLTGTMNPDKRRQVWQSKRVFFLTPQVLQNDLNRETCCANDIVCLVVDEAHRALGNHAYCQVIRGLCNYTRNFRVLALSATPGDDIQNVQKVIANLLISDVEIRSEESIDIRPYTHKRSIQKIVVPLSEELKAIKAKFLTILGDVIERLHRQQVLYSNQVERLSKYQILKAREQFRKGTSGFSTQRGSIEGDFALAISLYHAYELLIQQGMKSFYQFAKGIVDNSKSTSKVRGNLAKNRIFIEIMDELNFKFNRSYNSQLTPKSKTTNVQFLLNSHPKLSKLRDIVIGHFENFIVPDSNSGQSSLKTRIMIFAQYRDSVVEITDLLKHYSPTVKVMSFTGQATSGGKSSRGLSQKEQLKVIQDFRRGGYNTLVSTCVGEEGLDIGDVDLIICYDSNTSPIRLVQRMGRTGRKRRGRVVLLVTEGKEEQASSLQSKTENKKKSIHRAIRDSVNSFQLYQHNPRMVPAHLKPQPYKTELTVKKLDDDEQDITKSTHSNDNILAYLKKGTIFTTYQLIVCLYRYLLKFHERFIVNILFTL
ncbi:uncharacterized protein TRIADDRAFT_26257 [Trichoplax adhaerens]|uniref:DNA helicase n=1 Tax=Trichoplax adhaerens TaxID=10228 RepID=B3RYW6_TRIAD|nr:hypothetical protein TRIADDRAFT_26257 [Trichoplax adhaerens]EDV24097.1 hypothetical protein TRIADDRAFT_26257 [Trichoplax adhaerens]|eukprot:XP_002113623.1 hypothetical protein TRIADDRAFT_26257 [Trichoplax adhaerens]